MFITFSYTWVKKIPPMFHIEGIILGHGAEQARRIMPAMRATYVTLDILRGT
jgi:hypothetical protein